MRTVTAARSTSAARSFRACCPSQPADSIRSTISRRSPDRSGIGQIRSSSFLRACAAPHHSAARSRTRWRRGQRSAAFRGSSFKKPAATNWYPSRAVVEGGVVGGSAPMMVRKRLGFLPVEAGRLDRRAATAAASPGFRRDDLKRVPLVHHVGSRAQRAAKLVSPAGPMDIEQGRQSTISLGHAAGAGRRRGASLPPSRRVKKLEGCNLQSPATGLGGRWREGACHPALCKAWTIRSPSRIDSAPAISRRAAWIWRGPNTAHRVDGLGKCHLAGNRRQSARKAGSRVSSKGDGGKCIPASRAALASLSAPFRPRAPWPAPVLIPTC